MITDRCPPPEWYESNESAPRTAFATTLEERVEYLKVLASNLRVDSLRPLEVTRLRKLCRDLALPDEESQRVLAAAHGAGDSRTRSAPEGAEPESERPDS